MGARYWIGLAALLCAMGRASAYAEEAAPRVAIVAWGPAAADDERAAVTLLEAADIEVLRSEEVAARVRALREEEPSAAVFGAFAPATTRIAKGVERFFYMSPERALPDLEPFVDLATQHPAVLAFRPDLAEQIWQAGVLLVRAREETSGDAAALADARRLVMLFPTRELDPKVVPPRTREIIEAARGELVRRGRRLKLQAPAGEVCRLFLNGMSVVAEREYFVPDRRPYFAHADCGHSSPPPVWRVAPDEEGEGALFAAAVPPIEPHKYRPLRLDDRGRKTLAWYLRAVGMATGTQVLGLTREGGRSFVLRVDPRGGPPRGGEAEGDRADALRSVFPELARPASGASGTRDGPRDRPRDWFAYGLLGGSVVVAAGATYLFLAAGRQDRLLDCAVNNPAPPPARDCGGGEEVYFADFGREVRQVGIARAFGGVLLGSAVLAAGYGVYRLARRGTGQRASAALDVGIDGIKVTW